MEITWLGHACFRIRAREGVVVTDPAPRSTGYNISRPTADIVTVSCNDPAHDYFDGVQGSPRRLDAPGEYEISNVLVTGVRTRRLDGGTNTVFIIEMEEIRVCHVGLMDQLPGAAEIEQMSEPDVLLVPAGGGGALNGAQAAEVATLLEARYVIPMRYRTDTAAVLLEPLDPLDRFLKETGAAGTEPLPKLQLSKSSVPTERRVVVLDYKR